MAVFRVHKTKDYTVMSNYHLRDKGLTLKAKGLLSVILSLPDDWKYSISGLAAICKEGTSAVKSAIDELSESGYISITKMYPGQTDSGRIEYVYDIHETPQVQIKQGIENLPLEFQVVEKDAQLSTDNKDTDYQVKKTKERKKEMTYDEIISEKVQDESVRDALREFVKMRKLVKKPMTNRALTSLIKRLYTFSMVPSEQVAILERSITHNWLDVYALPEDEKQKAKAVQSSTDKQAMMDFFNLAG